MRAAVFTIVAKNYLAHARALMESVERAAPEMGRFVVLVDEPEGRFDPADEPFEILPYADLGIPNERWFRFKYNVLELCTAVKPYAAELLLERYRLEGLIYFDPDILVLGSLEPMLAELEQANVLLTPHLTSELDDGRQPSELDILRSGTHNLGYAALRRGPETLRLLRWWQRRLYDNCIENPARGLFVDQRWMDLAPSLFEGVRLVRDRGWNVAYWNLHDRPLARVGDEYRAGDRPLVFFHFSGYDPRTPETFSKHQNRYGVQDLGEGGGELLARYGAALQRNGLAETATWGYTWSRFADGTRLPNLLRGVQRIHPELPRRFEDPFSSEGKEAVFRAWNCWVLDEAGRRLPFTRFALEAYNARDDCQKSMPDPYGADRWRLAQWFATTGAEEFQLPDALVEPVRKVVERQKRFEASERHEPPQPPSWLLRLFVALPGLRRRIAAESEVGARPLDEHVDEVIEYLGSPDPNGEPGAAMPRIAQMILEYREDVAARFRDGEAVDATRYLSWLMTYGRREYGLPRELVEPIRERWRGFVAEQDFKSATALQARTLALSVSATLTAARPRRPPAALRSGGPLSTVERLALERPDRDAGVNLIGYVRAEMGVGESVRLAHRALEAAGVPVALRGVSTGGVYSEADARLTTDDESRYLIDLLHVNADQFGAVVEEALGYTHVPELTIGYWAWELEEFPESFDPAFELCGEVWTPSEFCRRAIAERSPHPVIAVPHPLEVDEAIRPDRAAFGLAPDRYVFLTMVDMLSVFERKNPLGAVRAFQAAVERMPNAELVVKVNNGSRDRKAMLRLREAAGESVRLIDETLRRHEVDSLLASADCFVSLHRSEGFGLGMAEAMALGKPVIATAYSGNLDFMDEDCAFLIDYAMQEVGPECGPYRPGAAWADPDIAAASRAMEEAYAGGEAVEGLAERGRRRVCETLAPARIGRIMRKRLEIMTRRTGRPKLADETAWSSA